MHLANLRANIGQCRQNSRLQPDDHPRPDLPAIHPGWSSRHTDWLELRPNARTDMAHHNRPSRFYRRVCDCRQHLEYGRALRSMLHIPNGCLLSKLRHNWMGFVDAQPNKGEESGMFCPISLPLRRKGAITNMHRLFSQ
jgi:hypothetical protein